MHRIRSATAVALFALLVAACEPTTEPTSTTSEVLPPPDPIGSTTTSLPVSTTQPAPAGSSEYHGFLPDGTEYRVFVEGVVGETIEFIDAPIVLGVQAIGIATFPAGDTELSYSFEDGKYRIPAGGAAYIEFYDHILGELGADAEETIRSSITGTTRLDLFPVLHVSPPFRWAEDFELPAAMEIAYHSFTVRRGCGDLAAACSETRAVQVIPIDTQTLPIEAWANLEVHVESPAPRPISDPYYLDPGPLSDRQDVDLVWTGDEMIVWGGTTGLGVLPTEGLGAALDPETNEWRLLASLSWDQVRPTRAIWGEGEMLVVSAESVFGYDPVADAWRTIADGVVPPDTHDRMLFLDGVLYTWIGNHEIRALDIAAAEWRVIPAPEPNGAQAGPYFNALRGVGSEVFAIIVPGSRGFGKDYWRLEGDEWVALPDVSLEIDDYADSSLANQAAGSGGELVIWEEAGHPVMVYSSDTDEWRELPTIPLAGAEGPSGPVPMSSEHFMVPRWGKGAVFDATTETWTSVQFPGRGHDSEVIWTGTEFLSWGLRDFETFDAWRWNPGQAIIGGDDAS